MKDGLENSFKEALNNFELPYDGQAWESLSQKLSAKKWYQASSVKWSAALLVAAGLSAYFVINSSNSNTAKLTVAKTTHQETKPTSSLVTIQKETANTSDVQKLETKENGERKQLEEVPPMIEFISEMIPHSIPLNNENDINGVATETSVNPEPTPSFNGSAVIYDFKNRCQGETFQLEGSRYNERVVTYAGKTLHFTYNEAISLKLNEVGKVSISGNSGPYGQYEFMGSFDVNPAPSISLTIDRNLNYEDGLPKINMSVDATDAQLSWVSNVKLDTYQGKTSNVLAFEKGIAIVEVQALGASGCKSKEKEMISISEDYNLLAVNAFNPQSMDSRNSSFMPFALTIRQTPFKLMILDPDNGGLIFQSTDASNAWDGIDRRDGKMVPSNKAYIWKVVLQNPVAGEKGEYRGTIVRM